MVTDINVAEAKIKMVCLNIIARRVDCVTEGGVSWVDEGSLLAEQHAHHSMHFQGRDSLPPAPLETYPRQNVDKNYKILIFLWRRMFLDVYML